MKVLKASIFLLLFLYTSSVFGQGLMDYDGNDWVGSSEVLKIGIVTGFVLGACTVVQNKLKPTDDPLISDYKNKLLDIVNRKLKLIEQEIGRRKLYGEVFSFLNANLGYDYIFFVSKGKLYTPGLETRDNVNWLKEQINIVFQVKDFQKLPDKKLVNAFITLRSLQLIRFRMVSNEVYNADLRKFCIYNVPMEQLVSGLDEFYRDFSNRKIKLRDAIYIIYRQINGENRQVIEGIVKYLKSNNPKFLLIHDKRNKSFHVITFPP